MPFPSQRAQRPGDFMLALGNKNSRTCFSANSSDLQAGKEARGFLSLAIVVYFFSVKRNQRPKGTKCLACIYKQCWLCRTGPWDRLNSLCLWCLLFSLLPRSLFKLHSVTSVLFLCDPSSRRVPGLTWSRLLLTPTSLYTQSYCIFSPKQGCKFPTRLKFKTLLSLSPEFGDYRYGRSHAVFWPSLIPSLGLKTSLALTFISPTADIY